MCDSSDMDYSDDDDLDDPMDYYGGELMKEMTGRKKEKT